MTAKERKILDAACSKIKSSGCPMVTKSRLTRATSGVQLQLQFQLAENSVFAAPVTEKPCLSEHSRYMCTCSGWMTWRGKEERIHQLPLYSHPPLGSGACTSARSSPPVLRPLSCCFDSPFDSFLGGGPVDKHCCVDFLWACDARQCRFLLWS